MEVQLKNSNHIFEHSVDMMSVSGFDGYLLIRLRFIWASISGWIIIIGYMVSILCCQNADSKIMTINFFFLISGNILGMFGGYALEYYTRKEFYSRHLLKIEQKKVKEVNEELEEKVKEKTKELHERVAELEHFREVTIERELRMEELRREIEQLKKE